MFKVYVFSGAGVSAESGLSTWRGSSGLWNGVPISKVCDYSTWKHNFQEVHDFYNGLRSKLGDHQPNAFHDAIAQLSRLRHVVNMTQNVDDLFERAGCASEVIHLHGHLTRLHCEACGYSWDNGYAAWDTQDRCRNPRGCQCRQGIKPDVVFFNEHAPNYRRLMHAIVDIEPQDIVVVAGTSNQVIRFDSFLSGRPGRKVWLNPERADSDIYDDQLIGYAGEQAAALLDLIASHNAERS